MKVTKTRLQMVRNFTMNENKAKAPPMQITQAMAVQTLAMATMMTIKVNSKQAMMD